MIHHEKLMPGQIVQVPGLGIMVKVETPFDSYNRQVFYAVTLDGSNTRWVFKTFPFPNQPNISSLHLCLKSQQEIETYKRKLLEAEVPVVRDMGFSHFTKTDGTTVLVQFESWEGETVTMVIRESRQERVLEMFQTILQQIVKPLFLNAAIYDQPARLSVGIDLIPRNLVYQVADEAFGVVYVDLFPPKGGRKECGAIALEYPEPTDETVRELGIYRAYNMAGILINLWAHLTSLRPELAKLFYDQLEQFIRENGFNEQFNLEEQINAYLLGRDISIGREKKEEIKKIIADWQFKDIFRFRLLACSLAYYREESRRWLRKLFEASHFQDSPLGQEVIDEIKEHVLHMASFPVTITEI